MQSASFLPRIILFVACPAVQYFPTLSHKGNTRLDKVRSEVIRKELEISGIQDVRAKYKHNWINHLERTDST